MQLLLVALPHLPSGHADVTAASFGDAAASWEWIGVSCWAILQEDGRGWTMRGYRCHPLGPLLCVSIGVGVREVAKGYRNTLDTSSMEISKCLKEN
ncbi:uncharacterized [Tachysurus ichikawai]